MLVEGSEALSCWAEGTSDQDAKTRGGQGSSHYRLVWSQAKTAHLFGERRMVRYGSLRQGQRVDLARSVPLRQPLSLYVEPTNICNFKCKFCPESFADFEERSGGFHSLSVEDFTKIAEDVVSLTQGAGVKTLNFYMMGEPLINRDLPEFIAIARAMGVAERLIVTSNGSLLKGSRAKALAASPPDFLRISIYGPTDDTHRDVTTSKVSLDQIEENIRNFIKLPKEQPCHVYVKMIDQGESLNRDFLNRFETVADECAIEPVMNWDDPDEGNLAGQDRENLLSSSYFAARKEVCPSPFYVSVIHADMQVSVCCVDWSKSTVIGDLRSQTLKEIWEGDRLHQFQMMHLAREAGANPACSGCTYRFTFPDFLDDLSPTEFSKRRSSQTMGNRA